MDLYRIILVDDEEEVRKSIIKKIDWNAAGFQVVGDAENGEEALEKIEALEPDVVLTDIRMPYMDGLTLAEKVRQRYPSTKIVIFSGYDDFEYAKQAIKLNVTEYILKPVNVEELTAILKRIKANLDEEIEQKRNVSLLRENYSKSLPILREQFLNDLVQPQAERRALASRLLREYDIPIAGAQKMGGRGHRYRTGGDRRRARTLPLHQEEDLIPISVMQIVEEKLKNYCRFSLFTSSPDRRSRSMAVIAAIDEDNTPDRSDRCAGRYLQGDKKDPGGAHHHRHRPQLPRTCPRSADSYKAAVDALGYKAIVGSGSTIYINDVEPVSGGKLAFDSKDEAELIAAVKFGPREKIEAAVQADHGQDERCQGAFPAVPGLHAQRVQLHCPADSAV